MPVFPSEMDTACPYSGRRLETLLIIFWFLMASNLHPYGKSFHFEENEFFLISINKNKKCTASFFPSCTLFKTKILRGLPQGEVLDIVQSSLRSKSSE